MIGKTEQDSVPVKIFGELQVTAWLSVWLSVFYFKWKDKTKMHLSVKEQSKEIQVAG